MNNVRTLGGWLDVPSQWHSEGVAVPRRASTPSTGRACVACRRLSRAGASRRHAERARQLGSHGNPEACRRLGHFRSATSITGLRRWPRWPGRPCPTIWINGCRRAASFIRDCPSQAVRWASTSISWISTSSPRKPRCERVGLSFHPGTPRAPNAAPPHCAESMSSEEPAAVAHAWSDLIGQLADRIAADAALWAGQNVCLEGRCLFGGGCSLLRETGRCRQQCHGE
jgi:hypothetical protein